MFKHVNKIIILSMLMIFVSASFVLAEEYD